MLLLRTLDLGGPPKGTLKSMQLYEESWTKKTEEILSRAESNYELFKTTSSQHYVDGAVKDYTLALSMMPANDPLLCQTKARLAFILLSRYRNAECRVRDLETALSLARDALGEAHRVSHRVESLSILGACLTHHFFRFVHSQDLEEAIILLREAVRLAGRHPDHPLVLVRLGHALLSQFAHLGQGEEYVEEAVRSLRYAVSLTSDTSTLAMAQDGLSRALLTQYFKLSGPHSTSPEEIMHLSEQALLATPPSHIHYGSFCKHLAHVIYSFPDASGPNGAMFYAKEALRLAPRGYRRRATCANLLGILLSEIGSASGASADLDETIAMLQEARESEIENDKKAYYVNNLSLLYIRRFEWFAQPKDVDNAIEALRSIESDPASSKRLVQSARLNLQNAFYSRYSLYGTEQDLDEAIHFGQLACPTNLLSLDGQEASVALCRSLFARGLLTNRTEALQDAIRNTARALDGNPGGLQEQSWPWLLLGKMYLHGFRTSGNRDNLAKGGACFRRLVDNTNKTCSAADRVDALAALASCGTEMFSSFGDVKALNDALLYSRQSVEHLPSGHAAHARYLNQLGDLHLLRYKHSGKGRDLTLATASFRQSALDATSFVKDRFKAATSWAALAHTSHALTEAMEGYSIAIDLLPRIAWLGMDRKTRFAEILKQTSTLACDAAACACELGLYELAVQCLEQGRAVFWQQHLALRSESRALCEVAPSLAEELREVARALEVDTIAAGDQDMERSLRNRRRLADRWDELIASIRQMDGFSDFLRPATFQWLQQSAIDGPIVILNISNFGCAALIVTVDQPVHYIPLPALRNEKLKSLAELLRKSLSVKRDMVGSAFLERATRGILDQLWTDVGIPVWTALSSKGSDRPQRVWWLPTGSMCLLPIHAATPSAPGGIGFPDLVTSSYTTTLGALIHARQRIRTESPAVSMVAVCPASLQELPRVNEEIDVLLRATKDLNLLVLRGEQASVRGVHSALKYCSWAHFACHGKQEQDNPLDSCLSLHDGPLSLSALIECRLNAPAFAYLSACHTAKGIYSVPDEAIHITAALQLNGFQGIVATMWSIYDIVAPTVADAFYRHITRDGHSPDHRDAADALRVAITKLRKLGVPAHGWVPFVHVGV